jgi:hypothetical protein
MTDRAGVAARPKGRAGGSGLAASMRRLLAAIDAGGGAGFEGGYRRQLHGAVVALEAMAGVVRPTL